MCPVHALAPVWRILQRVAGHRCGYRSRAERVGRHAGNDCLHRCRRAPGDCQAGAGQVLGKRRDLVMVWVMSHATSPAALLTGLEHPAAKLRHLRRRRVAWKLLQQQHVVTVLLPRLQLDAERVPAIGWYMQRPRPGGHAVTSIPGGRYKLQPVLQVVAPGAVDVAALQDQLRDAATSWR
jgi:hypothetical protein